MKETLGVARKLAYGYLAVGIFGFAVHSLRAPTTEELFWRLVILLVPMVLSLRMAILYAYRKQPLQLSWWLRADRHAENDSAGARLVYAVVFGAASLATLLF